jgi:hypothetical protein
MNRAGYLYGTYIPSDYPTGTYLVQPSDQIGGKSPDPSVIFQIWNERVNAVPPNGLNYRNGNFRLLPGIATAYPAYDARAIGADIDEIEALTGQAGVDVENGWPTFAERTQRTISTGVTGTVLSYLPNGSSCLIQIWSNSAYSGTAVVNMTDSAAAVVSGFISVALPGLQPGSAYYGKRWCGSAVDVFTFTTN